MEQTEQFNDQEKPSYWPSIGVAALIFGLISFVISTLGGYVIINSESSGSMTFTIIQSLIGIVSCLVGAFGGMLAVWHYARENQITMKLGKGALIGFLTGAAMILISLVLNQLWLMIDPDMTQKMIDSIVANFEAMDMPEEQKQAMIDGTVQQMKNSVFTTLLWGIPISGLLNLITGMLGVALFAKEKD